MSGPLLFIDSISDDASPSNQEIFDSRVKSRKTKAKYRVEDIEAMLYYRIHILAEIETKNSRYEGIVLECSEKGIRLQMENKEILIPIYEIEDINILKL